ncbi:hypothetical protein GUITHDRAFT_139886 [Guillardia theta CCMP2712]|uniref:YubB ferredoxin-like domain-containing protein n=1 Tax=Guillardia theta (strain CCMP2712) TaxID=905079 RepID=L1J7Q9_GUITC|nr:hypothetical protein GUITHDRAFT_139886 [Guillardia theta CCMP2712]EKX44347.1 hypothetical protein GUITHDRAFT_139886 [Guillardia theta CCMP2712]|eukprot:XP_005831327.1 hypothetical protein GUITHDRAFT_139886 [Guillardia theta CCMP2712]
MPNMCYNRVLMCASTPAAANLFEACLKDLDIRGAQDGKGVFSHFKPRPAREDYCPIEWSIDHWGTKWDVPDPVWKREDLSFHLKFETAWAPPFDFYRFIEYDGGWRVDGIYHEPGRMFLGRYANGRERSFRYDFRDPKWRDKLPQGIVEEVNLDREYQEWLENQDQV